MSLVAQGAEARVFSGSLGGRPCLVKERFKKSYRHPLLDERITAKRTQQVRNQTGACVCVGVCVCVCGSVKKGRERE